MGIKEDLLKARAHQFFVRVVALLRTVPRTIAADSIAEQLADSAGSTSSNYRGACKARSRKEFISKVGVAAEEADESKEWLESLRDCGFGDGKEVERLIAEADELTAIFVASHKTAQRRLAEQEQRLAAEKQAGPRTRRRSQPPP